MVKDAITDPTRIAELLASELTGLATGPLSTVEVVEADPNASPSPQGTVAYAVAGQGQQVGRVLLFPAETVVELDGVDGREHVDPETDARDGLCIERTDDGLRLTLRTGAAVKGAVDVLRALLSE